MKIKCRKRQIVTVTHGMMVFTVVLAAKSYEFLPCGWFDKRSSAWLNQCRRRANDWEKSIESATTWINIASIRDMT